MDATGYTKHTIYGEYRKLVDICIVPFWGSYSEPKGNSS